MPKDQYYNYGRQTLYVDEDTFISYFKVVYDRAGEYWKTIFLAWTWHYVPEGKHVGLMSDVYLAIDDRTHHSTYSNVIAYKGRPTGLNYPLSMIGPQTFTTSNLIQMSK